MRVAKSCAEKINSLQIIKTEQYCENVCISISHKEPTYMLQKLTEMERIAWYKWRIRWAKSAAQFIIISKRSQTPPYHVKHIAGWWIHFGSKHVVSSHTIFNELSIFYVRQGILQISMKESEEIQWGQCSKEKCDFHNAPVFFLKL